MAKMSKSEAVAAAKSMARENEMVNAVTLEQLTALDYQQRRKLANDICLTMAVGRIETRDSYIADCVEGFVETAMGIWTSKERALENSRKSFKRACDGITTAEATAKIQELFESSRIRGGHFDSNSIRINRTEPNSWNSDGTLYFKFDRTDDFVQNPDDANQRVYSYMLNIQMSTSGSSWNLATMAVIHKAQGELLDFANEVLAVLGQFRIIHKRGFEEAL